MTVFKLISHLKFYLSTKLANFSCENTCHILRDRYPVSHKQFTDWPYCNPMMFGTYAVWSLLFCMKISQNGNNLIKVQVKMNTSCLLYTTLYFCCYKCKCVQKFFQHLYVMSELSTGTSPGSLVRQFAQGLCRVWKCKPWRLQDNVW